MKEDSNQSVYQHLFQMGKKLLAEVEPDKLLATAMDYAISISGAERGIIILFDGTGAIQFQTARNLKKEDIENPEFHISRTIIEKVKTEKQPICFENALEESSLKRSKSVEELQLLSVICLPLKQGNELFGVVYLDNRKFSGIFKPETYSFVNEFTDYISLAAYQSLARNHLLNQKNQLEMELRGKYQFESIIGHHPKMVEILKLVAQVANSDATVLIQGESGAGKELIAQALHYNSHRKDKPFIPVNCGAIPEQLLESELFGHVRGAFTGAVADKVGWFDRANAGTIFLDEISDMSPALQVRLLRVLQTGEYSRVGSTEIRHCDVRVLAASSRNLLELIKTGKFREEVYYRLNVIDIHLPPLRERKSDVLLIAHHYLKFFGEKQGKTNMKLSQSAANILSGYDYPGNIRELVNIIQRAVVLSEGDLVDVRHLPRNIFPESLQKDGSGKPSSFRLAKQRVLEDFERQYIIDCLRASNGNITQAAQIAGMYVKNFFVKMKGYGIDANEFKST